MDGEDRQWLPAGAWQACADPELEIEPGEEIWLGVDLGGARADTALVWVTQDGRVGCRIFSGEDGIIGRRGADPPELAEHYRLREVVFDPWRAAMLVRGLEQRGIKCTAFQQSRLADDPRQRRASPGDRPGRDHATPTIRS